MRGRGRHCIACISLRRGLWTREDKFARCDRQSCGAVFSCRAVLIMLSFAVTTSLLAFVPPFAAGQFSIFGIQVRPLGQMQPAALSQAHLCST